MNYGKLAVSAIFTASLLTFGATDYAITPPSVVQAYSDGCDLKDEIHSLMRRDYPYMLGDTDGTVDAKRLEGEVFADHLFMGVEYEPASRHDVPDESESVVLTFGESGTTFNFFSGADGNYIRQYTKDGKIKYYHANFDNRNDTTYTLVYQWLTSMRQTRGIG